MRKSNSLHRLLRNEVRSRHHWIIGLPGTGKSKALETLMVQDMTAGRGFGMIDVHGDLYKHMIQYLSQLSLILPKLVQRVVLINPLDPDWVVSFNPLEVLAGMAFERAAMFLTDVIVKVWQVDPTSSPRMVWLLTNSFLALSDLGLSLLDLQRWLGDAAWRNGWLSQLSHEQVRSYWQYEFPQRRAEAQVWIAPVLNKIGPLIFDRDIRLMLSGNVRVSWRDILDQQLIVLVNAPKGVLGEGGSSLLAAFVVANIQKAALARTDADKRPPFYLYLDEFQNYTTAHIQDILTESRKYNLSLILAHQHLAQLTADEVRSAVINTTGSLQCFRVGHQDAWTLAKEIFPGPDYAGRGTDSIPQWLRHPDDHWKYRDWERLAQQLVNLPDRVFWFRRRGPHNPSRQRTLELPDPVITPQLERATMRLIAYSGQAFGHQKQALDVKLDDLTMSQDHPLAHPPINSVVDSELRNATVVSKVESETEEETLLAEELSQMEQGTGAESWDYPFRDLA